MLEYSKIDPKVSEKVFVGREKYIKDNLMEQFMFTW